MNLFVTAWDPITITIYTTLFICVHSIPDNSIGAVRGGSGMQCGFTFFFFFFSWSEERFFFFESAFSLTQSISLSPMSVEQVEKWKTEIVAEAE